MELHPTSESRSHSAAQEFPNIFGNHNVHCYVHKSQPLVSVMNQKNPVEMTLCCVSKISSNMVLPSKSRSA
jgi:hypothetical protein